MLKTVRRAVSRTSSAILVLMIFLVGSMSQVNAQNPEDKVTLIDNSSDFDQTSPIFISIWCQNHHAPGMELIVTTQEENFTMRDPNRIEISFEAYGQVDFQVIANRELR